MEALSEIMRATISPTSRPKTIYNLHRTKMKRLFTIFTIFTLLTVAGCQEQVIEDIPVVEYANICVIAENSADEEQSRVSQIGRASYRERV